MATALNRKLVPSVKDAGILLVFAALVVAPTGAGVEAGRLWPTLAVLAAGLILTPLLARRAA